MNVSHALIHRIVSLAGTDKTIHLVGFLARDGERRFLSFFGKVSKRDDTWFRVKHAGNAHAEVEILLMEAGSHYLSEAPYFINGTTRFVVMDMVEAMWETPLPTEITTKLREVHQGPVDNPGWPAEISPSLLNVTFVDTYVGYEDLVQRAHHAEIAQYDGVDTVRTTQHTKMFLQVYQHVFDAVDLGPLPIDK